MRMVITIGREFGSGGRELGKRLAENLQIAYYDKEIIAEIVKKTDLAEEYVQQVVENKPIMYYPITIGRTFYRTTSPVPDQNTAIYVEQENVLRSFANRSSCVIIGRCADYILRDMKPFRIFVYADMESKLARCRSKADETEHLSDKELRQQMQDIDRNREKYYRFITGGKWGDKLNYELCINSSNADIKEIAGGVAAMLKPKL